MARVIPLLLCALLACACATDNDVPPMSERYAPDSWTYEGRPSTYERFMRAVREPILRRPGDLDGFRRRLRMLFFAGFHRAYAVRVDELEDGSARVRIVSVTGFGPRPRHIGQEESFALSADAMRQLDEAIRASRLASLPARAFDHVCIDGAFLYFELADAQGSHLISRHNCDLSRELEDLVWRLDGLRRTVDWNLADYRVGPFLRAGE